MPKQKDQLPPIIRPWLFYKLKMPSSNHSNKKSAVSLSSKPRDPSKERTRNEYDKKYSDSKYMDKQLVDKHERQKLRVAKQATRSATDILRHVGQHLGNAKTGKSIVDSVQHGLFLKDSEECRLCRE
jgi:hypothetical protein